jgi:hypothetical protein
LLICGPNWTDVGFYKKLSASIISITPTLVDEQPNPD